MKDAGYFMTSSVEDTYRVYSNNVTSKWVNDGKISIDENIMKWVDDSNKLYARPVHMSCGATTGKKVFIRKGMCSVTLDLHG